MISASTGNLGYGSTPYPKRQSPLNETKMPCVAELHLERSDGWGHAIVVPHGE